MSLSLRKTWRTGVTTIAIALLGWGDTSAQDPSVFDLEWDGPETSTVEECVGGDSFCFTFPITGSLGVGFQSEVPYLINVESDILLPPQTPDAPPAISPNLWFNFDLLQGEYLPTDNDDDVSIVFRPLEIGGVLRAHEIFVNITNHGQSLELTGGIEQDATSPLEPDVRFSVSGRLITREPDSADLVDGSDFLALQRRYGASSTFAAPDQAEDDVVTGADFERWRAEYGSVRSSSATASFQTVPEPGAMTLAALFTVAELGCCWRRRSHSLSFNSSHLV